MLGHRFIKYDPNATGKTRFEQMLDLFLQLLTYTNGDVSEALQWMNELDKKYLLTNDEYGMGDFIDDLKSNGYIKDDNQTGQVSITAKSEQSIRKKTWKRFFFFFFFFFLELKKASRVTIQPLNPDLETK